VIDVGPKTIAVFADIARAGEVAGSPHLFLSEGTSIHNPGITKHWEDEPGRGFPVVDKDEPGIYEDLLRGAAEGE
jgi:hypothetical protein